MSFLWTGRSARHFRKGNRQKSKPKRYRGDLFHPVSYLQAPEEVMISPFRTKRKIRYPPSLRSSKLDLMDMILDRKYRHIIDAAKSHLLARGGDRYARADFYRDLTNAVRGHSRWYPPHRGARNPFSHDTYKSARHYQGWRNTSRRVDQAAGYDDWDVWGGMFVP